MPPKGVEARLAAALRAGAVPALAGALAGAVASGVLKRSSSPRPAGGEPNRRTRVAQLDETPPRRFYTGANLSRAAAIADLRARAHRRLPSFVLEYLEGGAEDEATLERERRAYAAWRFTPRTLVDVSRRTLRTEILGRAAAMPLVIAPTGLNGLFRHNADTLLARAAARAGIPFVQSTMSNDPVEAVARTPGLRHWWQLYVFGGEEVWRALLARAERAGCEALVLTTNTQIFGNREWSTRAQATRTRLSVQSALDAAAHLPWFASTLLAHGMPGFPNVIDHVPQDRRAFFEASYWIRDHQPTSLDWDTVRRIRDRWRRPFLLKGLMNLEDVRLARESGVDGVVLGAHGGRQLDWTVSALDLLPEARRVAGERLALYVTGGLRRGTDLLKAVALGADAVLIGRATLYGVAAAGEAGAARALEILRREALDALGLLGAPDLAALRAGCETLLRRAG